MFFNLQTSTKALKSSAAIFGYFINLQLPFCQICNKHNYTANKDTTGLARSYPQLPNEIFLKIWSQKKQIYFLFAFEYTGHKC